MYLPYDTSGSEQMDCYINTLDILQNIVDDCDKNCPIVIVGDMNTSLPKQSTLSPKWYNKKTFSTRSGLLYDFMYENNLIVGSFYRNGLKWTLMFLKINFSNCYCFIVYWFVWKLLLMKRLY